METCITCGRAFEPLALDDETLGECLGCWDGYGGKSQGPDDINQYFPPGSPVCVDCD